MKLKEIRQSQKEFSTGRTFLLLEIAAQLAEMNERQTRAASVNISATEEIDAGGDGFNEGNDPSGKPLDRSSKAVRKP
jgi:hypothetical protein